MAQPTVLVNLSSATRDSEDYQTLLQELHDQAERERLLVEISYRIRQVLDLDQVLETTVREVRRLLKTDRVVLYKFAPNWSGTIVVESVGSQYRSILNAQIHDPCFADGRMAQAYAEGWIRVINDIYDGSLNPCHVELLEQFEVRANLVVPIVYNNNGQDSSGLWGLLIAHHCTGPRFWQQQDLELLQKLSVQVAIAIHQAQLYQQLQDLNATLEHQVQQRTQQLQQALDRATVLSRITAKIRDTLDEELILEIAVQELAQVMQADYCCTSSYDLAFGKATIRHEQSAIEGISHLHQQIEMGSFGWVYDHLLQAKPFVSTAKSEPGIPFNPSEPGDLLCPRPRTGLAASLICPIADNQGILGDVGIFYSHYRPFEPAEIELVQQVANQCAIALRQARLYHTAQLQVKELEKLNQLKDDFLSTVSHELRTPMANIKMAAQLLRKVAEEGNTDRQSKYLDILESECKREIDLINDLLDLQKMEDNSLAIHPIKLDLDLFLHQICNGFLGQILQRQQHLEIDIASDLPEFSSDPTLLSRILTELVTNACKYSPPGSRIRVQVAPFEQSQVMFAVTNPAEISPQEIDTIFQKFYRIPNTDPWRQGGTGLGLALVKKGVEQLQGKLQVSSQSGSTRFEIILPRSLSQRRPE